MTREQLIKLLEDTSPVRDPMAAAGLMERAAAALKGLPACVEAAREWQRVLSGTAMREGMNSLGMVYKQRRDGVWFCYLLPDLPAPEEALVSIRPCSCPETSGGPHGTFGPVCARPGAPGCRAKAERMERMKQSRGTSERSE